MHNSSDASDINTGAPMNNSARGAMQPSMVKPIVVNDFRDKIPTQTQPNMNASFGRRDAPPSLGTRGPNVPAQQQQLFGELFDLFYLRIEALLQGVLYYY